MTVTAVATAPSDRNAEQALIAAAMAAPATVDLIAGMVRPGDFYWPVHETLWRTVLGLRQAGKPVHPTTVQAELARTGELARVSETLVACTVDAPPAATAEHMAGVVRNLAACRSLIDIGRGLTQQATLARDDAATILARAETELHRVPMDDNHRALDTLLDFDEFLAQDVPQDSWVIPHRLARGERLIITAGEGVGKSTLTRQIAVCAAAGLDPFDATRIEPQTVLVIDVENPLPILHNRFAALRRAVAGQGVRIDPRRLWIDRRPEGLNLGSPADRLWLQRRALSVNPSLIVIGPVYKLYVGGASTREEDLARQVTVVIDQIKTEVDAAVVLEHHAPHTQPGAKHRDLRPIGSSLWMRWPEFGMGLRPVDMTRTDRVVELEPWRGNRDVRQWPVRLRSGSHGMPWIETTPEG